MSKYLPLAALLGGVLVTGCGDGAVKISGDDACYASRSFVRSRLKAPSSAEFERCSDARIAEVGANQWRVDSYVDAQNVYGAPLRTPFTCTLHYDSGSKLWVLDSVELSG